MMTMKCWSLVALLTLTALPLASAPAHACSQLGNWEMSLAGSYETGKQRYSGRTADYEIRNCKKSAGQYIVFTTAPQYTDLNMKGISAPEGELPADSCYIDQSPFNVSRPTDIGAAQLYREQVKLLSSCLEMEVSDLRGQIDADVQLNCEVSAIDRMTVKARGPRCVFKIYEDSDFKVKFRLADQCLKKNFLKEQGDIKPMDAKTQIGVYQSTDLSPGNPDYGIIGFLTARVSLQPDSKLMPVSGYFGRDTSNWPMQFGAQVSLGRLGITKAQATIRKTGSYFMRVPFLVNNNCGETCADGICSSPCSFYAPIAAHFTLSKSGDGETSFHPVDWWYQGAVVPGHFLGEMSLGRNIQNDELNTGDRYRITAEFSSPAMTYRVLMDQAKQMLIKLSTGMIPAAGAGTGALDGFSALGGLVPASEIPDFGDLSSGNVDTSAMIGILERLIGADDSWPPYYSKIVNGDQSDGANKVYMTLQLEYRIAALTPGGGVAIDSMVLRRKSKVFGDGEWPLKAQPQIKCPQ